MTVVRPRRRSSIAAKPRSPVAIQCSATTAPARAALALDGLRFRADWEAVVAAIVAPLIACPKVFHRFRAAEGAGEHCDAGARGLLSERVFDWLDGVFGLPPARAPVAA